MHREWGRDGDSNDGNGVRMGTVYVGMGMEIKFLKLWGCGRDGNRGNGDKSCPRAAF